MAEAEWQGRVDRLDEVTLVQARIMDRLERKYDDAIQRHDEAIQRHDEEFSRLQGALEKLVSSGQKTNEAVDKLLEGSLNTKAAVDALIETVDKFIRGKDSNGRKK